MQEGVLPSLFNTAENLDYVGPYPEPRFYGADYMSGDERAQFLEWYEEQKDKIFCNKQELLADYMDNVSVLRQTCCAFRNLFLKLVKMDPFRQAVTISSIFNKVFLKRDTVGIIPRVCTKYETASLLKAFNGWRTMLLMLEMEGGSFSWDTKSEIRRVLFRGEGSL